MENRLKLVTGVKILQMALNSLNLGSLCIKGITTPKKWFRLKFKEFDRKYERMIIMDNKIKETLIEESKNIDILAYKDHLGYSARTVGDVLSYLGNWRYLTIEEWKELDALLDKAYNIIRQVDKRAWNDEDDIVQYGNVTVKFDFIGDTDKKYSAIITDKINEKIIKKTLDELEKIV